MGLVLLVNGVAVLHHRQDRKQMQAQMRNSARRRQAEQQAKLLQNWDPSCRYFSGSVYLPCAVNPQGSCRCREYESS